MRYQLREFLKFLQNGINVPGELESSGEFKVLHLSDTPSTIYPAITDMLAALRPDAIIHTGDIADDIKLGDSRRYLRQYRRTVEPFLKSLALSTAQFYIVPGNHDSEPFIESNVPPGSVVNPGFVINIGGTSFGVAHYLSDLPDGARYNLYGHNLDMPDGPGDAVFLNGVRTINVILLPSGKVISLRYPNGTNHYRKYRNNPPKLF
ncbi:MAG: metallophosphoesterase [Clostridia bacterium]|jgi:predicted phosphodiesterase|nr:metallophosphoesterase [Clostridiales bacterium]